MRRGGVAAATCVVLAARSLSAVSATGRVVPLRVGQASAVAQLVSDAFPLSAPHSWARALGMEGGMVPYMTAYLEKQLGLEEDKSFGLVSAESQDSDLCGALVVESHEWKDHTNLPTPTELSETYGSIEAILAECERQFSLAVDSSPSLSRLRAREPRGRYGYLAWMATKASHRGQGVAHRLLEHGTTALAARPDVLVAVGYTVSPAATRVFKRQGYSSLATIKYSEFEYLGRKPFAILPDEISVMVKTLRE